MTSKNCYVAHLKFLIHSSCLKADCLAMINMYNIFVNLSAFFLLVVMDRVMAATSGLMTMWGEGSPGPVTGSSCEYASDAATKNGSKFLDPFVRKLFYCAVDSKLYESGKGCGKCYRISFDGVGGTDPGRPGSAEVQIVDSGSAKEFDCHLTAFQEITGANTGVFPITYTEIPCSPVPQPTVVVLDGDNAYYTKVLFADGPSGVKSATMSIGTKLYNFQGNNGATYFTQLDGTLNQAATFEVTFSDGSKQNFNNCFNGAWPVPTSTQCTQSVSVPTQPAPVANPSQPVQQPVTSPFESPVSVPIQPAPVANPSQPVQQPVTPPTTACSRFFRPCSANSQCCSQKCRRNRCRIF